MTGECDLGADPGRCPRRGPGHRLAAPVGLGIHVVAFDLAQDLVDRHQTFKNPLCRIIPRRLAHLGEHFEIHPACEIRLGRSDHHALHGIIRESRITKPFQFLKRLIGHHIERRFRLIPRDHRHAVCVHIVFEIGHGRPPQPLSQGVPSRCKKPFGVRIISHSG